jgi:Pentapeptide repeats (8 copies)
LESADLSGAHLENATLSGAHLKETSLIDAHLEGAHLLATHLEGAYLLRGFLNAESELNGITLYNSEVGAVSLGDVRWGDVNLAVVDWSTLPTLGDEFMSQKLKFNSRMRPFRETYLESLQLATRAYRQLAVVLRNQGLNEEAARFAYRGQLMQRKVFWSQGKVGQYLFSLFLDLLAGYGYKPERSFITYLIVISAFAVTYYLLGRTVGPVLSPLGSVVFSMTSFHGRGFFPGGIGLDDPLTVVAATEAFVGLLIEVTFIATLTQRLFGK